MRGHTLPNVTSSLPRGRLRRAGSHISARVAHTVLGGAVGVLWLVLPGMTSGDDVPVAIKEPSPAMSSAAAPAAGGGRPTVDLVLPLVAVGAAGAIAGYGYVRRVRRIRSRTTPGGASGPPPAAPPPPLAALDEEACAALVAADDRLRAARCELGFAEELFEADDTAFFRRTLTEAEAELAAAFRMRQRYDEGVPHEDAARGHALAGIVGRCAEAERRLDSTAAVFEAHRAPGRLSGEALVVAEGRFRELTGRVAAADTVLAGLRARYAPTATAPVTGNVEQAKDRLLFATVRLNEARQSTDSGRPERAARQLRAAEGAIAQAAVLVEGVDRLAAELRAAERMVPEALTEAEAELSRARERERAAAGIPPDPRAAAEPQEPRPAAAPPAVSPGELHARLLHAATVLASVRHDLPARPPADAEPGPEPTHAALGAGPTPTTGAGPDTPPPGAGPAGRPADARADGMPADAGPGVVGDPVAVLRRIVRAVVPVGPGREGAVPAAALLVARAATAAADDFVETHRGAVGPAARTRLAEARRLLATQDPQDRVPADALALDARELAELDVRAHGNPYAGADHTVGVGGAVLGGVVPADDPEGGRPAGFGGPAGPSPSGG